MNVTWDDDIANIWENKIHGNQTTNQNVCFMIQNPFNLTVKNHSDSLITMLNGPIVWSKVHWRPLLDAPRCYKRHDGPCASRLTGMF